MVTLLFFRLETLIVKFHFLTYSDNSYRHFTPKLRAEVLLFEQI